MIISTYRRFIFIHIYKNAGTSITNALLPFALNRWQLYLNCHAKKHGIDLFNPQPYENHISANQLIEKITKSKFDSCFSFAVVRNPWDWQVSLYTYMLRETEHYQHDFIKGFKNFDEYIEWRCSEEVRYQKDFIYDESGNQLVSFVGRFENIEADFKYICTKVGITANLPMLNISRTKPFQEYYNRYTVDLVRRTFAPDISLFGYEYYPC